MAMKDRKFEIRPLTGQIGAEVRGIDISQRLTEAERQQVLDAFLLYKVLVLRNQQGASDLDFVDFCRTFGPPEVEKHPQHASVPGVPAIKVLRSNAGSMCEDREYSWHMDGSTRASGVRQWVSLLRAVEVPEFGRDTGFADMEGVFYRLSDTMQQFLSGLRATHSWGWTNPGVPEVVQEVAPLFKRTGRRHLYVSPHYTTGIVGMRPDESELLLKFLFKKATRLEHQVRVNWEPGTIGIWDNARTLHAPIMDIAFPRVMHRVMLLMPDDGKPWEACESRWQELAPA